MTDMAPLVDPTAQTLRKLPPTSHVPRLAMGKRRRKKRKKRRRGEQRKRGGAREGPKASEVEEGKGKEEDSAKRSSKQAEWGSGCGHQGPPCCTSGSGSGLGCSTYPPRDTTSFTFTL